MIRLPTISPRSLSPLLGLVLMTASVPAGAADSLATPMSGRMAKELWPIEVSVEVVRIDGQGSTQPLSPRTVIVPDGHRLRFSSTVPSERGKQRFELTLVPRHHPDDIEVEWDLEVHEAKFRALGLTGYLRHRLNLGQRLPLGEERLKIARSDIVSTEDGQIRIGFEVDGDSFEIRLLAATTRG